MLPKKNQNQRLDKVPPRKMSLQRQVLFMVTTLIVTAIITASLWISIAAITDRVKTARSANQIIDLVDLSRRFVDTQHGLGSTNHIDVLLLLSKMKQIEIAGDAGKLKSMTNPWGGAIVVYTNPENTFRIETVLPSRACVRVLNLLAPTVKSLGVRQIDSKVGNANWQQIYRSDRNQISLSKDMVSAGCLGSQQAILGLTFSF